MEPQPTPEEAFDDIRLDLAAEDGVAEGRMFQSTGLTLHGKFFAAMRPDGETMLVKLPEARVAELIAAGTAQPFTTGTRGPMREWALVPPAAVAVWAPLVTEAIAFARANAATKGATP